MKSIPVLALTGLVSALFWLPAAKSQDAAVDDASGVGDARRVPSSEEMTLVIRYDPEAIYLTHELVEPLCRREVKLKIEGEEETAGRMFLLPLEGNALQPKGVYVGVARVDWKSGTSRSEEDRERLMTSGLNQLQRALSQRLYGSQERLLRQRLSVVESMLEEREMSLSQVSRKLAASEQREVLEQRLKSIDSELKAIDLERGVARMEMMEAMNTSQGSEQAINAVAAKLDAMRLNLARQRKLFENSMASESEISKAEVAMVGAESELAFARGKATAMADRVRHLGERMEALESQYAALEQEYVSVAASKDALPNPPKDALDRAETRMLLDLEQGLQRDELNELRTEVYRLRSKLTSLTEPRIERW